ISTALLQRAVRDVAPAVATKDTRPILMGIQLRLGPHHFQALATDGFRVAHVRFPLEEREHSVEVVAPARGLLELTRILEDRDEEEVEIAFYDQRLGVELPGLRFYTSLLNGSFPDVLSMVPTQYPTTVKVMAGEMVAALQRSLIIAAAEKDHSQVISLQVKHSGLQLSAKAADVGSSSEEVEGEGQGPELQLAFNGQFLLEGLRAFPEDEEVELRFAGPSQALLLASPGDSPYRYYLLPVLLS
ncbi:MAG: DNA polymerase III subunit beta, partial [Bacillota bacterium]|nr:DNA polymerase III subunit beta [Bacillota bacterium]